MAKPASNKYFIIMVVLFILLGFMISTCSLCPIDYKKQIIKDVLLDPYVPPLKDESQNPLYIPKPISSNPAIVDIAFSQIGILIPLSMKENANIENLNAIIPLMGRTLSFRRDKYQYYTISNQHNNIKLPIIVNGRNALNEYGVDTLYDGDVVYIDGFDASYRVKIYSSDINRYIPLQ